MPFLSMENLVGALVRAFACVAGSISKLDAMFDFSVLVLGLRRVSPVFFEKPALSTHPKHSAFTDEFQIKQETRKPRVDILSFSEQEVFY